MITMIKSQGKSFIMIDTFEFIINIMGIVMAVLMIGKEILMMVMK